MADIKNKLYSFWSQPFKKNFHDATTVTIAPDPNPDLGVGRSGFTLVVDFIIRISLSFFLFYL